MTVTMMMPSSLVMCTPTPPVELRSGEEIGELGLLAEVERGMCRPPLSLTQSNPLPYRIHDHLPNSITIVNKLSSPPLPLGLLASRNNFESISNR